MRIDKVLQNFRTSELQTTLERRLSEKSTRQLENFVGFAQLFVLALQRLHVLTLEYGDAVTGTGIDLVAFDPFIEALRHTADLGCHRFDRGPQRGVPDSLLAHHADIMFAHLG